MITKCCELTQCEGEKCFCVCVYCIEEISIHRRTALCCVETRTEHTHMRIIPNTEERFHLCPNKFVRIIPLASATSPRSLSPVHCRSVAVNALFDALQWGKVEFISAMRRDSTRTRLEGCWNQWHRNKPNSRIRIYVKFFFGQTLLPHSQQTINIIVLNVGSFVVHRMERNNEHWRVHNIRNRITSQSLAKCEIENSLKAECAVPYICFGITENVLSPI